MKNLKLFAFLALAFLIASPASALQTKKGNYKSSDEVWTDVEIHSLETTEVIPGMVLEYDTTTDTADENSYTVRVANASADHSRIAGVAQTVIATGDTGRILVRGAGQLRVAAGTIASGDYLYASATAGALGVVGASGAKVSAFALEAESSETAAATIDAYIVVV